MGADVGPCLGNQGTHDHTDPHTQQNTEVCVLPYRLINPTLQLKNE